MFKFLNTADVKNVPTTPGPAELNISVKRFIESIKKKLTTEATEPQKNYIEVTLWHIITLILIVLCLSVAFMIFLD